ncbi:serine/threonine-protein phosphatase 6 regulatory ankyrin repeat subunit A [Patella vulgata]|uniref:serine/threonine-protein phosphatase 6 regulatory ankyrin repeat subunit A n=1 Tax=Patella vulgata TaxID=6465 RepID=UPI0021808D72|nr:serine/threonine-protein phosphatase 6 regulatory ankyrin repeat subunit A [Patella vulgata]
MDESDEERLRFKLRQAEEYGNIQEVVERLSLQDKMKALPIAASNRFYKVMVYLLEHGIVDVHYVDRHQNNLLNILLDSYDSDDEPDRRDLLIQCVVTLVDAGVDVNQENVYKDRPIFKAAERGLYEVVMYLLKHGVDVYHVDRFKNNLIHQLLDNYDSDDKPDRRDLLIQCVFKSVDAGVDVNQENVYRPIFVAAREWLFEVVMYLLKHGVDVYHVDIYENNLIHQLLYNYDSYDSDDEPDRCDLLLQCVETLVDAGVDVNQENVYNDRPIFIAARRGLYEVVMYLLKHEVDVHVVYRYKRNLLNPLLYSYERVDRYKNNLIHQLLYSYDSDDEPDRCDLFLQCVVTLVDAGVDVNQEDDNKVTPIFIAARKGLYEVVMYLLEHGVDVHGVDRYKRNLINQLLYNYDRYHKPDRRDLLIQCVFKSVDAGVDVNQEDDDKHTPIFIAARRGLYEVVMYLLKHGVDIYHVDRYKSNILHYVVGYIYSYVKFEEKCLQVVNTLIKTGLEINQPDYDGKTPLFCFGMYGIYDNSDGVPVINLDKVTEQDLYVPLKCKLINMLLDAGCNVNHQNKLGQTALMHHIQFQTNISILKLLIPHSDLSLTDNKGKTAISYCVQYHMINSTYVFKLLVDSDSDLMSGNNGVKLFHDILKCKRSGVFSYYIGRKLIVNGLTDEGENMLHLLAGVNYDYSINKFKWLLNNELDINHPCSKTNTPTMIAAFLLNSKYLKLLTHHPRLEINTQNNQGHTALHLCIIGFTMFKDGLNKRQVNDVVKNYCRQIYPIYMACIDILLGVDGIDVNIPDNGGRTSLMMAAMKNDRFLTRKLLQAGAIVTMLDYSGRSALQYLDIYQSVFDLTCFKLLLSNGNTGLLNLPCIDGNTIIQTALRFPFFWEPLRVVRFIRYLVAENCCVQTLITSSGESRYNQIDLTELSSSDRDKLRKLLYLSGAQEWGIITTLNFDGEDHTTHSQGREEFISFCSNISLKSLCRRFIRQNLGLGIKEKVRDLELPRELKDFLLLKDVLHPKDYNIDDIDDGCNDFDDDDYDGYDIDRDRDDDYSQYNYQYFTLNTDHELRQYLKKPRIFPNGDKHPR